MPKGEKCAQCRRCSRKTNAEKSRDARLPDGSVDWRVEKISPIRKIVRRGLFKEQERVDRASKPGREPIKAQVPNLDHDECSGYHLSPIWFEKRKHLLGLKWPKPKKVRVVRRPKKEDLRLTPAEQRQVKRLHHFMKVSKTSSKNRVVG